jgi:tripartite-type tricarboxylate transporter receptor subunit TctC
VPYRGSAPAMTDLLAGSIHLMFEYPNPGLELIRAGRVRPLAVAARAAMPVWCISPRSASGATRTSSSPT